jgi:hypothetical protein
MPHRRNTITVATSALLFVCLMLHAQASLSGQTFAPYNDAEAYKIYESLLPTDWTVTAAHARRLLIRAQTGSIDLYVKPQESATLLQPLVDSFAALNQTSWLLQPKSVASSAGKTISVAHMAHSRDNICDEGTFAVLEKKDGLWKNMRWMGTSCPWAS